MQRPPIFQIGLRLSLQLYRVAGRFEYRKTFPYPTDFIVIVSLRRSILVVERSPRFPDRGFAADHPISSVFKPLRLPFPVPLWSKSSQEVPAIHPVIIYILTNVDALESINEGVVKLHSVLDSIELTLLVLLELRCCSL